MPIGPLTELDEEPYPGGLPAGAVPIGELEDPEPDGYGAEPAGPVPTGELWDPDGRGAVPMGAVPIGTLCELEDEP